jgi:hypothetical protein
MGVTRPEVKAEQAERAEQQAERRPHKESASS